MQSKQDGTLSEVSDIERAYYEMARIRKEIDGVLSFLATRIPNKRARRGATAEVIDPRTKKKF